MEGKKLLVLSDTHGCLSDTKAVFKWTKNHLPPNDTINSAVFLGDGYNDICNETAVSNLGIEWKFVRGNNDFNHLIPESLVFDFSGYRFFLCHGHRHGLYGGYSSLIHSAQVNDANVVLFGHIHYPYYKIVDNIYLINPGSAGRPRGKTGSTFAIIECSPEEKLSVKFYEISGKEIIREIKI